MDKEAAKLKRENGKLRSCMAKRDGHIRFYETQLRNLLRDLKEISRRIEAINERIRKILESA